MECPRCGSAMRERKSEYGLFLGCSQYPKCKGTRKLDIPFNYQKKIADDLFRKYTKHISLERQDAIMIWRSEIKELQKIIHAKIKQKKSRVVRRMAKKTL